MRSLPFLLVFLVAPDVAAQPGHPVLARATAALEAGRFDEADRLLSEPSTPAPPPALVHNLRGRIRSAQKRWVEAATEFESAACLLPEDAVIAQNLGVALFEQREVAQAKDALKRALTLDAGLSIPHLYLGRMAEEAGDLPAAAAAYEKARALAPEDPWPCYFLGGIFLRDRRVDEAVICFEDVLKKSPDLPGGLWNLGIALQRAGRQEEAGRVLARFRLVSEAIVADQALKLRVTSRVQTAQRDLAAGRADAALLPLLEAVAMAPDVPAVRLLLAEVYRKQGRKEESERERATFERLSGGGR